MIASFTPALFTFLTDLAANNDRTWFAANRSRYAADVEAPMRDFLVEAGARLATTCPAFATGIPARIHRDTRFSADKTPYKVAAWARFPHRARHDRPSVPAFYVYLAPGNCRVGGGIHQPDPTSLGRIRDRIVDEPDEWTEATIGDRLRDGDSLKRAPAGYDPNHPLIRDLRRKEFFISTRFSDADTVGPAFVDSFVAAVADAAPLVRFLTAALNLDW